MHDFNQYEAQLLTVHEVEGIYSLRLPSKGTYGCGILHVSSCLSDVEDLISFEQKTALHIMTAVLQSVCAFYRKLLGTLPFERLQLLSTFMLARSPM
jgi:hypothetical protein